MSRVVRMRAVTIAMAACWFLAGGAAHAQGQAHGYMRVITASGRQMAGESTDPAHNGWIPFTRADMPTASEMAAIAQEAPPDPHSTNKVVHRPVVIVKERDKSSLGLLSVMSSHQVLPEVQIAFTDNNNDPTVTYKLTDATVIAIRAGDTNGDTEAPLEQVRFNYTKIEIVK